MKRLGSAHSDQPGGADCRVRRVVRNSTTNPARRRLAMAGLTMLFGRLPLLPLGGCLGRASRFRHVAGEIPKPHN